MNKTELMQARRELKNAVCNASGCRLQYRGWPCGTCFFAISKKLTEQDWQAVLLIRGDYKKSELNNLPKDIAASLKKTLKIALAAF